MMRTKSALSCLIALGAVVIALVSFMHLPRSGPIHRKWTEAMSFGQVQTNEPFSAIFEGISYGFENPTKGGASEYVLILLRTTEGKEITVYQMHPDSNTVIFANSLVVGEQYEFPRVLPKRAAP